LTLFPHGSAVSLPVRSPQDDDGHVPAFVVDEPIPVRPTRGGHRQVIHDLVSGRSELRAWSDKERVALPDGLELTESWLDAFAIVEDAPLSAEIRCERTSEISRGDWRIRVRTVSTMSADETVFRVTNALDAYEGATRVAARRWEREIPRDHV
jgi:uncharacterized protein